MTSLEAQMLRDSLCGLSMQLNRHLLVSSSIFPPWLTLSTPLEIPCFHPSVLCGAKSQEIGRSQKNKHPFTLLYIQVWSCFNPPLMANLVQEHSVWVSRHIWSGETSPSHTGCTVGNWAVTSAAGTMFMCCSVPTRCVTLAPTFSS